MSFQDDVNDPPNVESAETSPTTSFVYPVRTLLSGIQRPSLPRGVTSSANSGVALPQDMEETEIISTEDQPSEEDAISCKDSRVVPNDDAVNYISSNSSAPAQATLNPPKEPSRHRSANFRDFSVEDDPLRPRSFISNRNMSLLAQGGDDESSIDQTNVLVAAGPVGEPVVYHREDLDRDDYDLRHPAQLSEAAAGAFSDPTSADLDLPQTSDASNSCSNFSQLGLVHLGPTASLSQRSRSVGSGSSHLRERRTPSNNSLSPSLLPSTSSLPSGHPDSAWRDMGVVHLPSTRSGSVDSGSRSGSGSALGSVSGASSEGPRISFRYQHIEDEEGHHLVVGREGKLTKCEDEPIRTPGAVQGYGVLIVIEEDYDTGFLSVRQVSENATQLMGLSPSYLFSLDCFTQTLSDSQADVLLDNTQYLSDAALTPEEQAENLHIFMLSGFGEPESALAEESSNDPQRRRNWVCWCAAHRPQMTAPANLDPNSSTSAALERNVIILEFELERDHFNPLYPATAAAEFLSGVSSPSDASGSNSTDASNSGSSGRTLVSSDSEVYETTPEGSNPSLNDTQPPTSMAVRSTALSPSPSSQEGSPDSTHAVEGPIEWMPSSEVILESTTSHSKPLLALERLRRIRAGATDIPGSPASFNSGSDRAGPRPGRGSGRPGGRRRHGGSTVGMMDVFAVMAQINEQFGAATDLEGFLKIVVGVLKDLTQFHRVLVYQFDEAWNGKVMAELVDWNKTHDLYHGLHFPAADIPAQARQLYALNKVRSLYDRGQPTARLVLRSKRDMETPLDMTHCYLRAMSPIHIKYLGNMGVRASMSVSIMAFGQLWGLIALHSYGPHGMRVSFPVRQMLRLLSQSISRNVERLCYAQRLHTRKLINAMPTDQHPTGYIVSDADDLLGLFDADYGVLVIGEGAKILGPNQHGQEILVVAEYLRMKQFNTMQVSQAVTVDYPDLQLSTGLEVIAGLLYVPLSVAGGDFIAFLRKGQPTQVHWAGRPRRDGDGKSKLEPRSSFKAWSEVVAGRCRAWTDEHLETAGVLALVYGKFIEVWRQKESALQTTKLTNILLSNASHEVRTPLNHIINYLEMALNSHLDIETRENLSQSHAASKNLLFTINDLLDLTRLESGNETSFNEPFDLHKAVKDATLTYRNEAQRRGLKFTLDFIDCPRIVLGDSRKIRTVVANLTANALKYTAQGEISVQCRAFEEPHGLRNPDNVAVEIVVSDTGCGISSNKLESIFREFEQVEASIVSTPSPSQPAQPTGLGLGLAVVARIVEQLGGQLRVDSKVDEGSRFSFLLPFEIGSQSGGSSSSSRSRYNSHGRDREIESLVQALASRPLIETPSSPPNDVSSKTPLALEKEDALKASLPSKILTPPLGNLSQRSSHSRMKLGHDATSSQQLRILIVEDNDINRTILAKRLTLDGHIVVNTTNGQEGLDTVEEDQDFDCVLMDIQMPLLNGYEATERIRALEIEKKIQPRRLSHKLNGRIPVFAVSASLFEVQRDEMYSLGIDGWILKPIDFKRLKVILRGVTDPEQRAKDVYYKGISWEIGGWLAPAQVTDINSS